MSLDQWVSVLSAAMTFIGLLLVVIQLRAGIKQRESESLVEIYDINRELIALGFSHSELFAILDDAKGTDPVLERRYLQLWLNQLSLIHSYLQYSVRRKEFKESLEGNVTEFFSHGNMRRHWEQNSAFYPASFQKLVNGIIAKVEPPVAAQLASGI